MAFYGTERPASFVLLSFHEAPWMTPERVHREGLLAVCLQDDPACAAQAERLAEADTRRLTLSLQHELWGQKRDAVAIDVFVMPPHP